MEAKEIYVADFVYGVPSLNRVCVTEERGYYRTTDLKHTQALFGHRFEGIYFSKMPSTIRFSSTDFEEARRWLDERIATCISGMYENMVTLSGLRVKLAELSIDDPQKEE